MLILILIDVHQSQKAVFSFEKGSNHQYDSSSGSRHPVKFPICPTHYCYLKNSAPPQKKSKSVRLPPLYDQNFGELDSPLEMYHHPKKQRHSF